MLVRLDDQEDFLIFLPSQLHVLDLEVPYQNKEEGDKISKYDYSDHRFHSVHHHLPTYRQSCLNYIIIIIIYNIKYNKKSLWNKTNG